MVNAELLNYVRGQIAAGVARDQIKKTLATGGWTEQDANEAFMAIDGVRVPPPPPPPAPPPATTIPPVLQPVTPVGQPMQAIPQQPVGVNPNYQPPVTTAQPLSRSMPLSSPMTSPIAVRKKRRVPWAFIIVIFILLIAFGLAYFAWPWISTQYSAYKNVFLPGAQTTTEIPPAETTDNSAGVTATSTATSTQTSTPVSPTTSATSSGSSANSGSITLPATVILSVGQSTKVTGSDFTVVLNRIDLIPGNTGKPGEAFITVGITGSHVGGLLSQGMSTTFSKYVVTVKSLTASTATVSVAVATTTSAQ